MSMMGLDDLTLKQANPVIGGMSKIAEYVVPEGKVLHVLPLPFYMRLVAVETFTGTVDSDPVSLTGDIVDSPNVSGVGEVLVYKTSDASAKALASIDYANNTITPSTDWEAVGYTVFHLFSEGAIDFRVVKENGNGASFYPDRIEDIHIRNQYANDTVMQLNIPVPIPEYAKLEIDINSARTIAWDNYVINSTTGHTKPLNMLGIPYLLTDMPQKEDERRKLIDAFDAALA